VAIGYRRWQLALMLLEENLLMTAIGGALGLGAACLFDGHALSLGFSEGNSEFVVRYTAQISPRVLVAGAAVAAAISVLGGIVPGLYSLRMPVLKALRG